MAKWYENVKRLKTPDVGLYNFSKILNLFDSDKLYALTTRNRKCANKCIIFGEALKIRVKKFKQNQHATSFKQTLYKLHNLKNAVAYQYSAAGRRLDEN